MGMTKSDLKQVPEEWKEFLDIVSANGKAKWILELGTFRGKGTIGLSRIAKKVITIDIDDRRLNKLNNTIFLKGNTHDENIFNQVKKILGEDKLDAIFIDADHQYEGVKKDFEWYVELVKDGGVIGLHDIVDSPRHRYKGCLVFEFWNEIKDNYKYKELIYDGRWAGIGVIWK